MRSFYSFLIVLFCLSCTLCLNARERAMVDLPKNGQLKDPAVVMKNDQANTRRNLLFVENKGQIVDQDNQSRPDIQYKLAASGGLNVFIGSAAIHYQFSKADNPAKQDVQDFKQMHPGDK